MWLGAPGWAERRGGPRTDRSLQDEDQRHTVLGAVDCKKSDIPLDRLHPKGIAQRVEQRLARPFFSSTGHMGFNASVARKLRERPEPDGFGVICDAGRKLVERRGIFPARLGRPYVGIELRAEQVAANQAQADLAGDPAPRWIAGDSRDLARLAAGIEADLVFSCPPYWNLERYSDDPSDLSTMPLADFLKAQAEIIVQAVARLRPNRFAVWVIGDVRDADGFFVNLPGLTVEAFEAAGARFYNDAILVTAVGSLPIRVGRQFTAARKLGRTHQNVLVFCKGDPRKATEACGPVEFGEIEGPDTDDEPDPEDDQ